jgi:hypothetical protein
VIANVKRFRCHRKGCAPQGVQRRFACGLSRQSTDLINVCHKLNPYCFFSLFSFSFFASQLCLLVFPFGVPFVFYSFCRSSGAFIARSCFKFTLHAEALAYNVCFKLNSNCYVYVLFHLFRRSSGASTARSCSSLRTRQSRSAWPCAGLTTRLKASLS